MPNLGVLLSAETLAQRKITRSCLLLLTVLLLCTGVAGFHQLSNTELGKR